MSQRDRGLLTGLVVDGVFQPLGHSRLCWPPLDGHANAPAIHPGRRHLVVTHERCDERQKVTAVEMRTLRVAVRVDDVSILGAVNHVAFRLAVQPCEAVLEHHGDLASGASRFDRVAHDQLVGVVDSWVVSPRYDTLVEAADDAVELVLGTSVVDAHHEVMKADTISCRQRCHCFAFSRTTIRRKCRRLISFIHHFSIIDKYLFNWCNINCELRNIT